MEYSNTVPIESHLVTFFLSLLIVLVAGFALTFRILREILNTLRQQQQQSQQPQPSPPPADGTVLYSSYRADLRMILVVAGVSLGVVYGMVLLPTHQNAVTKWVTEWGWIDNETRPLGVWLSTATVDADAKQQQTKGLDYQWHAFDAANRTRYPVIACSQHAHTLDLQEQLLGDGPKHPERGRYEPAIEAEYRENAEREERARARARKRCVLNPPQEHLTLDPFRMRHLTAPQQPSLSKPLAQYVSAGGVVSPLAHFLQARDGTRVYSLLVVVPNKTDVLPTEVRVERRVVTEEALLQAPRDWYHPSCMDPKLSVNPCICPSDFGILGSGLYFHYAPDAEALALLAAKSAAPGEPKTAEEIRARCRGKWRLWAQCRFVRDVGKPGPFKMTVTDFSAVDEKLNFSAFYSADMTEVEYMDVATVLESPQGQLKLDALDPAWLTRGAGNLPPVDLTKAPLLSVLALSDLAPSTKEHRLQGTTNLCFNYCMQLEKTILRQAGVAET